MQFGFVTDMKTAAEVSGGGSKQRHLQLTTELTGTNQPSVTSVLALVISENNKQTKRARDQNQSSLSERPNKILSLAELVLDPSEVLLNLLIATGFSGAITKTLSHSTVH